MAEHPMETTFRTALWRQLGAAIDMLENALVACPASLWRERLWSAPSDHSLLPWIPPEFSEFGYIAYHTLFWLDLYLSGSREEDFAPPAPFIWTEGNPAVSPERPYTTEDLLAYLVHLRKKCQTTIAELSDKKAHQQVDYPWTQGKPVSYVELLLYTMRHVQEHAAQLSLFLGQHGIPDEALNWVARAKEEPGSH
ncbi:MAG TPA: DinB family protein [Ktedonobacteraceae bacterium]|nr:DinB family protein [Ktedonobacteraceae bacterium]